MTAPANIRSDNPALAAQMRPALVQYFKRKTGSTAEAEDLAHDVLMGALKHASWSTENEAKGYIFRAAVNRWHDRHRRLRARGSTVSWDSVAESHVAAHNGPERLLIATEELDQVALALEELSVRTRTVIILIRLEQMKIATVAEMLGISVSAVNKHLSKGLAHLAQMRKQQEAGP